MNSKCVLVALIALILSKSLLYGENIPSLADTFGSALDQTEILWNPDVRRLAPLVPLVKVIDNAVLLTNKTALRDPSIKLDLHVVTCDLEGMVKGEMNERRFKFYYYSQSETSRPNRRYAVLFRAEPGKHYLFFLSRENGVLRSIGDVGEFFIEVYSGRHSIPLSPGSPQAETWNSENGRRLAEVLLTPGEELDYEAYSKMMVLTVPTAQRWSSRKQVFDILKGLTSRPQPLRSLGCTYLTKHYLSQYGCLISIADDLRMDQAARSRAFGELTAQKRIDQRVELALSDWEKLGLVGLDSIDSISALLDEFQMLMESPNVRVRKLACALASRLGARSCSALAQ
jgi:hypothetical protein